MFEKDTLKPLDLFESQVEAVLYCPPYVLVDSTWSLPPPICSVWICAGPCGDQNEKLHNILHGVCVHLCRVHVTNLDSLLRLQPNYTNTIISTEARSVKVCNKVSKQVCNGLY
jgi:hypothetical protein